MDHNPHLKNWKRPMPNNSAGKGRIERPGESENIVWQTREAAPTEYQFGLADALISAFDAGVTELGALTDHLNGQGVLSPNGDNWTEQSLAAELARLGH